MFVRGNWARKTAGFALALLMVCSGLFGVSVRADSAETGLQCERMWFRDVLRLYTANPAGFGVDAAEKDASGVTNAARRLAELFACTVGLNYTGTGLNSEYFAKDITALYGTEPYTADRLLASYDVEIAPYHAGASALPAGQTTTILVYLAGYDSAASGVDPICHYVWKDGSVWYAVMDDFPFYYVSYDGMSARTLAEGGLTMVRTKTSGSGTGGIAGWEAVSGEDAAGEAVQCADGTVLVGNGCADLFGVTDEPDGLAGEGAFSARLLGVSDFVPGASGWTNGPLVYERSCAIPGGAALTAGEKLQPGTSYRFRVTYDEALTTSGETPGVSVSSGAGGACCVTDLVWYGASEYLLSDTYDPHTVEFTFSAQGGNAAPCVFSLTGLTGHDSGLRPASFCANLAPTASGAAREAVLQQFTGLAGGPGAPVSRGVLAEVLWNLCGQPESAAGAQAWAESTGLILGDGTGSFDAEKPVTREAALVILYRYARLLGGDAGTAGTMPAWSDGSKVSGWAAEAATWAAETGVVTAGAGETLRPGENVTCREAAEMLSAVLEDCLPSV